MALNLFTGPVSKEDWAALALKTPNCAVSHRN
jgi:hypothetical protein